MDASKQVCVVGGANVDIEGRSTASFRAGDSNPGTVRRGAGGVGRNIAENLARLGAPVSFISAVGDDEAGAWLLHETAAAGVDVDPVLTCAGHATSTYLSILDGAGELVGAVNDMAVLDTVDADIIEARRSCIRSAVAVVVDCNLRADALAAVIDAAAGAPVFVDPVSSAKARRIDPHLHRVHLLKPNATEAALLAGSADPSASTTAPALVESGVEQVVISLGHDGVLHATAQGSGVVPPVSSTIVSVTGAGDALMAGLVWAHLDGADLEAAVRFAVGAAAVTAASERTVSENMSVDAVRTALCAAASEVS